MAGEPQSVAPNEHSSSPEAYHKPPFGGSALESSNAAGKRRATIATQGPSLYSAYVENLRQQDPFGPAATPSNLPIRYNVIAEDGSEAGIAEPPAPRPLRVYGGKVAEQDLLRRYDVQDDPSIAALGKVTTSPDTGSKVIIKKTLRSSLRAATEVDREITVLSLVSDSSILAMHEALEVEEAIWTVSEYRTLQTVGSLVSANGPVSDVVLKTALNQLFSGIAALFMAGYAHLRICDQTVSLDHRQHLVITDFHYACEYQKGKDGDLYAATKEKFGSDIYVAPEVYAHNTYNARKASIWSCGVLIYYMVSGQTEKLSNITHPSFENTTEDSPRRSSTRRASSAATPSKMISYPNRFDVPNYARMIIPKMLATDPLRRAELIEIASRVPKDYSEKAARPLIELAWLDYKYHVGPLAPTEPPRDDDNASSFFSFATSISRMSNPFATLLGRGHSRRHSTPVNTSGSGW